jgi:hypothetical protein
MFTEEQIEKLTAGKYLPGAREERIRILRIIGEKNDTGPGSCWTAGAQAWAVDRRAAQFAAASGKATETRGIHGDIMRFHPDGREEQIRGSNRRD